MSHLVAGMRYIFDAKPDAWVAIFGTLSGILISTLIGLVSGIIKSAVENNTARKKASIFFIYKLSAMLSDMQTIRKHFADAKAFALLNDARPAMMIRPPNKIGDQTKFSEENLWILTKICGALGINSFGNLDSKYNIVLDAVEYFSKRHFELYEMMPDPVAVNGRKMAFDFSKEEYYKIYPRISEMEDTIDSIIKFSRMNEREIYLAMKTLVKGKKFPYKKFRIDLINPGDPSDLYICAPKYRETSVWKTLIGERPPGVLDSL